MINVLVCLTHIFWIICIACALLASANPAFKRFAEYGKLHLKSDYIFTSGQVFTSYYLIAIIWNGTMLYWVWDFLKNGTIPPLDFIFRYADGSCGPLGLMKPIFFNSVELADVLIPLILFQLHVSRRLYECCFVHMFSKNSGNSLLIHIAGIAFYLGIVCSIAGDSGLFAYPKPMSSFWTGLKLHHIIGTLLFAYSSVQQMRCHRILASLRKSSMDRVSGVYKIPVQGWFKRLCCPHYFAEICLYIGITIAAGGGNPSLWLATLWTLLNLWSTANATHTWYQQKFKENYSKMGKYILIPWIH